MTTHTLSPKDQQRRAALDLLSKSTTEAIREKWEPLNLAPQYVILKQPEIGMVMVQSKAAGRSPEFNLGEMTVTRTVIQLESQEIGYGYTQGRDKSRAELIALIDACLQVSAHKTTIEAEVLAPLEEALNLRNAEHAQRVERTKVNFFTMVRGE